MTDVTSIASARRLAGELHRLRLQTGMSGESAAAKVGWSPSKISRMERFRHFVSPADLAKILALYKVPPAQAAQLQAMCPDKADRPPGHMAQEFDADADMGDAVSARDWAPLVLPRALQTRDYAHAVCRSAAGIGMVLPSEVSERISKVEAWQARLLDDDRPLELAAVIDESVLYLSPGSDQLMHRQLERLIELGDLPHVTVQVLADASRAPLGIAPFTHLRFEVIEGIAFPEIVHARHLDDEYRVEPEAATYRYALAFGQLSGAALDPAASAGMIKDVLAGAVT
jgi:transcriptional regulator with XRE-family HTH domain